MSIEQKTVCPPNPSTTRGQSVKLSTSRDGSWLSYGSGKCAVLRPLQSIDPTKDAKLTTLFGHTANVLVSTISPTGYYVASGDAAGNLKVWSTIGDQTVKLESKPIASIRDVAFDGEGKRIVLVGEGRQGFAATFNLDTGSSIGEIGGHSKCVNAVALRQDRPFRAATASDDLTVCLHTGVPFKFHSQHRHHARFVQSVAYAPAKGPYFASAGSDGKVVLYDGSEGTKVAEAAFEGTVFGVAFDSTGTKLATAGADGSVRVLSVPSLQIENEWAVSNAPDSLANQQAGVAWAGPDQIVSCSLSGTLSFFSPARSESPTRTIFGHQNAITALAVSASSSKIVTTDSTGLARLWNDSRQECVPVEGTGHSNLVVDIVPVADDAYVSIGWDDTIRFIDSAGRFTSKQFAAGSQPRGVAYSQKTNKIYVATTKSILSIDQSSSAQMTTTAIDYEPTAIAVSPDGKTIIVTGQDLSVHIYDATSMSQMSATETRTRSTRIAFGPDELVAIGDANGKVHLYRFLPTSKEKGLELVHSKWSFQTAKIHSLAWSQDGTHLASASLDESVRVYSVAKPSAVLTSKNVHRGGTNVVAWVAKDELVTAGADGSVKYHAVTFKS